MYQLLMSLCGCPLDDALTPITVASCEEQLKQVQGGWFARDGQIFADSADQLNNIPATTNSNDMTELAYWTTLFTAADSTKVVTPPLFAGDITITPGTKPTSGGGDNSTLNGRIKKGETAPADFSARYDNLGKENIAEIRKLECEGDVGVFLITSEGKIGVWQQRDSAGVLTGVYTTIPVYGFELGTKGNQGFGTDDSNIMAFQIPDDYDEHLTFIKPADFKALKIRA